MIGPGRLCRGNSRTIEMAPSENRLTRMRQVTFDYAGARNISDVTGNDWLA